MDHGHSHDGHGGHGHSHDSRRQPRSRSSDARTALLDKKRRTGGATSSGAGADAKAKSRARCQLLTAICFCFFFMCAEVVGGYYAHSLAIMTDAAHLLSDVAGLCINVFALWMSSKPPTSRLSYGYHRVEVLGALASVGIIWLLTGVLVYEAILRIIHPVEVKGEIMFFIACAGLIVNLSLMKVLHQGHGHSHGGSDGDGGDHGHSHSGGGGGHGHSHGGGGDSHGHSHAGGASGAPASPEPKRHLHVKGKKKKSGHGHSHGNMGVRAAFIHAVGDLVQSIGVMIAGGLIWWKPEWHIADPMCTFVFSIMVLFTTIQILRQGVKVLLDSVPDSVENECLLADMERIDGVIEAHDLHVWSIGSGKPLMSVHLRALADHPWVLRQAQRVSARHGITHTTIQVETVGTLDERHCLTHEPCDMAAMRTGCAATTDPSCKCPPSDTGRGPVGYGSTASAPASGRRSGSGSGSGCDEALVTFTEGDCSDDGASHHGEGHGHSHGDHDEHGHSHSHGHGHGDHGDSHSDEEEESKGHGHSRGDHDEHGHSHSHGHGHGDHGDSHSEEEEESKGHGHSHAHGHGHSHGSHDEGHGHSH